MPEPDDATESPDEEAGEGEVNDPLTRSDVDAPRVPWGEGQEPESD